MALRRSEVLRVAIFTENLLPKINGSTITLAHLFQHLHVCGIQAMLFGPESGMIEYAGAKLFDAFGVPLRVYPGLKINEDRDLPPHQPRDLRRDVWYPYCAGRVWQRTENILFPSSSTLSLGSTIAKLLGPVPDQYRFHDLPRTSEPSPYPRAIHCPILPKTVSRPTGRRSR
ncbi:hypothetical protein B0H16DRAFT_1541084 [Mycena metata]|uniref:Uncharacterized protein n=1 Tax=Mycena metata TaxID=1033252 RepID=A0AAD7J3K1_9AGAR|nr:hypothetical protein B0H16DRAFT_1541084 [Mycena metata]